jgi:hypothetical protein
MIFVRLTVKTGTKAELLIAVKEDIPHICTDIPLLLSVEAAVVCILIGNTEMLLHKSLHRLWSDADITVLLGLRSLSWQVT